ncbi:NAD(P)H-dependent oxidoreductase [Kitasatospora sp. NPDC001603]|uniref:NADPH-dependent FMN reductase n=1 Tax=Kitasatospora sp. NPDC001603 TaxID=3154388 RepID=UPI003325097F
MSARPPGPRILGLGGSLRPGSTSQLLLRRALAVLDADGCRTSLLDLRELDLPFCNGDKQDPWPSRPDVKLLREEFRAADGVILAGPEYHGTIGGALKNALDLLDFEHVEGKVFGAICALGGRNNSNALNHLRLVARWYRAWMVPEQVAVPQARGALPGGEPADPELGARVDELARSVARAAALLRPGAAGPAVVGSVRPGPAVPEEVPNVSRTVKRGS